MRNWYSCINLNFSFVEGLNSFYGWFFFNKYNEGNFFIFFGIIF